MYVSIIVLIIARRLDFDVEKCMKAVMAVKGAIDIPRAMQQTIWVRQVMSFAFAVNMNMIRFRCPVKMTQVKKHTVYIP